MQNGQDVSLDAETTGNLQHNNDVAGTETGRATRGTVTRNPVITAVSRISTILDGFEGKTQQSIFRFLAEQYGFNK